MGNQIGNLMLENPIQCQKGGGGWEGGDRKSARDRRSLCELYLSDNVKWF